MSDAPAPGAQQYPMPEAHVAARVILVQCPDHPVNAGGVLTPRGGFDVRAAARFPTLRNVEGPFVNGLVAFTWQDDPATDDELVTRSAQAIHDELALAGEWDGYSGWYGDHAYIENADDPGSCAYKPRDVHNQLPACGEPQEEH